MLNQFSRTQLLLGVEAMDKLKNSRVAVFGVGGVGGYVCEALVRSGVGQFDLIDDDKVCLSNINRQIIATHKTVGKNKVEVMKERMMEINPDVTVNIYQIRCTSFSASFNKKWLGGIAKSYYNNVNGSYSVSGIQNNNVHKI